MASSNLRGRPAPPSDGTVIEEVDDDAKAPVPTDIGTDPRHTPPNEAEEQPDEQPLDEDLDGEPWDPEIDDYHGQATAGPAPIDEDLAGAETRAVRTRGQAAAPFG